MNAAAVLHVAAGAEALACPGEHDAADVVGGRPILQGFLDRRVHVGMERVAAVGAVEGDHAHVPVAFEDDVGVHVPNPWPIVAGASTTPASMAVRLET